MRLKDSSSRRGVVLIAVLIVVVLLSLAAYKYNDLMTAEYRATDSTFRAAQARANAASGVSYVAALLATNLDDTANGNPWDNATLFQNIAVGANDKNPGRFSIVSIAGSDDAVPTSQGYRFGLSDEAGKINVNALLLFAQSGKSSSGKGGSGGTGAAATTASTAPASEPGSLILMTLPNMTQDIANAILDWIDPTDPMRTNGAKDSYYSGLSPSYRCKNGPLDSLEEMLLIKGVTPQLLFGSDKNRNGVADPDEDGGGTVDLGWSAYLTVHSREANFAGSGQPRIWLNDQTLDNVANTLPAAVGEELSNFIIAARLYGVSSLPMGGTASATKPAQADLDAVTAQIATDRESGTKKPKDIKSLWSLVNATVSVKTGTGSTAKTVSLPSPLNDTNQQRTLMPPLFDTCTVTQQLDLTPRININTASTTVLNALQAVFNISDTDFQSITGKRPAPTDASIDPIFKTPVWLLTEANVTMKTIKQLDPFITTRSQVYRFQSVGYSDKGGPVSRIDAIVDANQGRPRIVFWRDLSELGKGFDIPSAGK